MNYNDYMVVNYGIPLLGFIITFIAQIYVNNSYNKYKYQNLKKKTTGAQVAREILDHNGLENIKIVKYLLSSVNLSSLSERKLTLY